MRSPNYDCPLNTANLLGARFLNSVMNLILQMASPVPASARLLLEGYGSSWALQESSVGQETAPSVPWGSNLTSTPVMALLGPRQACANTGRNSGSRKEEGAC